MIFAFVACRFGHHIKKSIVKRKVSEFFSMFSSRYFIFSGLTFESLGHFLFFFFFSFELCKIGVRCLSFVCEHSIFPTTFTDEAVLYPLGSIGFFFFKYVSLFLGSLFCSTSLRVINISIPVYHTVLLLCNTV